MKFKKKAEFKKLNQIFAVPTDNIFFKLEINMDSLAKLYKKSYK